MSIPIFKLFLFHIEKRKEKHRIWLATLNETKKVHLLMYYILYAKDKLTKTDKQDRIRRSKFSRKK